MLFLQIPRTPGMPDVFFQRMLLAACCDMAVKLQYLFSGTHGTTCSLGRTQDDLSLVYITNRTPNLRFADGVLQMHNGELDDIPIAS